MLLRAFLDTACCLISVATKRIASLLFGSLSCAPPACLTAWLAGWLVLSCRLTCLSGLLCLVCLLFFMSLGFLAKQSQVAGLMQISDGESFEQWRTFSLPRCLEIGNLPYLRQRPSRRSREPLLNPSSSIVKPRNGFCASRQRMLESVKQTFGWVFHAWQVETLRSYEWRLVQESGLYTHGAH